MPKIKSKTAQEIQDDIFRKMSAEESLRLVGNFYRWGWVLNKLGTGYDGTRSIIRMIALAEKRSIGQSKKIANVPILFVSPEDLILSKYYGIKKANQIASLKMLLRFSGGRRNLIGSIFRQWSKRQSTFKILKNLRKRQ